MTDYLEGTEWLDNDGLRAHRDNILRHHRQYMLEISDKYYSIQQRLGAVPSADVNTWVDELLDLKNEAFKYENIPEELKDLAPRAELERIDPEFMSRLFD